MILLRHKDRSSGIFPAEFPALNTWEELCERQLALDTNENLPDKYKQIVLEINRIHREKNDLYWTDYRNTHDPSVYSSGNRR
jgi:hypothetical protein